MAGYQYTPARFWKKVARKNRNGCRLWRGPINGPKGYGQVNYQGWRTTAHRVAYFLAKGDFDRQLVVMHMCAVPLCCEPSHLRVGTQAENLAEMAQKGRARNARLRGEDHGMCKITDEEVIEIRELYASTRLSQQAIAERYGCGQSTVARIVNGIRKTRDG